MSSAPTIDRRTAAHVLEQIAGLLELKGENQFRVRAFRSAARAVAGLQMSLQDALSSGTLAGTRGVGPATLQIVSELATTGRVRWLDELRAEIPPGLVEMLRVPGFGIAKIRQVHELLGIDSLIELEAAARDGRLARLPRFGPKTAENILRGISFLRQSSGQRLHHHALAEAETLRAALSRIADVAGVTVAGDVRRRMEVVREIVLVVVTELPPAEIFRCISEHPGVDEFAGQDERRMTVHFAGGTGAQVVVTTPVNAGAVLVQATGSDAHLRALAARAGELGLSLHGAALWRGSAFVPTPEEAVVYETLGLAWVPPELREGHGEVELAARDALPTLVERSDLRGFLHCHTKYSDGTNTVEEIATACREAGYRYVGITDHSAAAAYAGGLAVDALRRQADEIDALNERIDGIRVLKGIEADILQDGSVDYDEAVLAGLDFVIGSVHSRFGMGRAAMTSRILAAMDSPFLTILGHPTGRLLLSRDPYDVDIDAIIEKAAATGVALEINADPHRLDLDWRAAARAHAAGVTTSIGSDAHGLAGIGNMDYGVAMARKAGIGPDALINARPVEKFLAFARARR